MIEFLRIQNLALIQDMEMEFVPGLNVLTGESGAGKSFILKALDFLLGEKLQSQIVRGAKEKAVVEAIFSLPDGEYVLRRELTASTGRSRIYVNDRLSSQNKISSLRNKLLVHTSQHGQQSLLKPAYHTKILDGFLAEDLLQEKERLWSEYKEISAKKSELQSRISKLNEQREFLEYQYEEIEKVNPMPGEEEELLARKDKLRNMAACQASLNRALELLHGQDTKVLDNVVELQRQLSHLSDFDEQFFKIAEQCEEFRIFLQETDLLLRNQPVAQESEQELEAIESRLWKLSQLERRLKRPLKEIISLKEEISENLSFLDQAHLEQQQLCRQEREILDQAAEVVQNINQARKEAAQTLAEGLQSELRGLGFSEYVQVSIEFNAVEGFPGIEELKARILWIPNPGQQPQPLDQIASGGELSRFLLALVSLRSEQTLPTLLFDEVDAGIGGITLNQVGDRIRSLADRQQVLLISHWPQLASLADQHFQVSKEVVSGETYTQCQLLSDQEIAQELARMAGGGEKGKIVAEQLVGRQQ